MLILVVSIATYISLQKTSRDNFNPADSFNLIFKYGVGAKNELNTFNGTYTKDLVLDPSVTIKLTLTNEEKLQILQKIAEMDLLNFPDNFSRRQSPIVTPQTDYYIKVQNGSQIKEISWNTNSLIESNMQNSLEQFVSYLIGIIEQKPEYKALSPPRGGYV